MILGTLSECTRLAYDEGRKTKEKFLMGANFQPANGCLAVDSFNYYCEDGGG